MDRPLRDQIRYLELRLDECRTRPGLHGAQLDAYGEQLELARQAATGRDYLVSMGRTETTMAITRAEWLDRHANQLRLYQALGDDARMGAARHCVDALRASPPSSAFVHRAIAAQLHAASTTQRADGSERLLPGLFAALLEWRVAAPGPFKVEAAANVAATWATMRAHDPRCTWQRMCTYPPYRERIPFDRGRLAWIGGWLREIVGAAGCDAPLDVPVSALAPAPPAVSEPPSESTDMVLDLPSAQQAAAGYRAAFAALDPDDPGQRDLGEVYQAVFELEAASEDGPAFLRAMAEADMYTRLARSRHLSAAREAAQRCADIGQPHAAYHHRALERALTRCRSVTEVDFEIACAEAMYAIEVAWMEIVATYATRPIIAIASHLANPTDPGHRQRLATATDLARRFFGQTWDELLNTPWLAALFDKLWFPRARAVASDPPDSLGARFGEVGTQVVGALRQAGLQRVIERCAQVAAEGGPHVEARLDEIRSEPVFATPAEMRAHLERGYQAGRALEPGAASGDPMGPGRGDDAGEGTLADDEVRLHYWGRAFSMAELDREVGAPARPVVAVGDPSVPPRGHMKDHETDPLT